MIPLKTPSEIAIMRENGRILALTLRTICEEVTLGKSTASLDHLAEELIRKAGAQPAFKGYQGYPATICASINDEVVHGIPSERLLKAGDILSIDIGLFREGLYADMATTVPVGEIDDDEVHHLLRVTEESLWQGIKRVTIGNRLSDISHAIGSYVKSKGLHVVREYVGHGIGRRLHEEPQISNYGLPGQGPRLQPGMVFAIEPMVKTDSEPTRVLDNNWTVVTATGGLAAHFEHTVALTERGVDVLTLGGE